MKLYMRKLVLGIVAAIYISWIAIPGAAYAIPAPLAGEHFTAAGQEPTRGYNPETGNVSFIGGGSPIEIQGVSAMDVLTPQDLAQNVIAVYGAEFGLANPGEELTLLDAKQDDTGNDIVHYQQVHHGVPVIAGELIVNLNSTGELLSMSGEVSPELDIDVNPVIGAESARATAIMEIANVHDLTGDALLATNPELWIFDESLLTASTRPVELVWRMDVTPVDVSLPIREMVLVNAQSGEISFHVNQVDAANSLHGHPKSVSTSMAVNPEKNSDIPAALTTWPVYFDIELDESRGWIYGSDSTGNKIDVIDSTDLQLVKSFILANGATPKGIALSPDGTELAIAQNKTASILFLNPDTGQTLATLIPNSYSIGKPWDVLYGRTGRLYASGTSDYIHIIDTATHLEISRSARTVGSSSEPPYLAIASTNDALFVNEYGNLYKFDVSTDILSTPINTSDPYHDFAGSKYVLSPDNSKIFTSGYQVWKSDLSSKIGGLTPGGSPAILPNHDAIVIAVDNASGSDTLEFVSTDHFYTLFSYPLPGTGNLGALIANPDGSKLYVSTSSGMIVVDLTPILPGTPVPLPSGPLPYYDLIIDEPRGVLYGSDWIGDKIDVISMSTQQVIKNFRLVNGAGPKGIALSPDGSELVVAQAEAGGLVFLNPDTGESLAVMASGAVDVLYGRAGRLYAGSKHVDVIDTATHTIVGASPGSPIEAYYLTMSSDKRTLFTNGKNNLYKLDVSTDVLPAPMKLTATSYFYSNQSVLLVDDTKIITDHADVWSSDFKTRLGWIEPAGTLNRFLAPLPTRNIIAVGVDNFSNQNDEVWFTNTDNFYTLSKYTLPTTGTLGPMVASADGSTLFVNHGNGIIVLNLTPTLPGTPTALPSGSLPYVDIVLDEERGVIYGCDLTGNKIDVISTATLQVIKNFRLINGAEPKAIALSPDGSELAVAQSSASSILFLDPDTGETLSDLVPNTPNKIPTPKDMVYGRAGRLYSTGNGYIHVIDTALHMEIGKTTITNSAGSYLAISSDKRYLYTNTIGKFDVSTDTFLSPIKDTSFGTASVSSILLVDDTKIFTNSRNVWNTDLNVMIGAVTPAGFLTYLTNQDVIAIGVDNYSGNDAVVFVNADNFYTLSTYTLPTSGTLGHLVASSDGSKLFVNTSAGFTILDLASSLPGTPVPLPSGPLPYFDLIADAARGVFYGSDLSGNKIDVISDSTLEVIKSFRLPNGAAPRGIALSPDGNELAIAQSGLYSLLFLNPDTGETIAQIPNLAGGIKPSDVIYGRLGRLYSSGISDGYFHNIDTTTHTEINKFTGFATGSPFLTITSDKRSLLTNGSHYGSYSFSTLDVSTDTARTLSNSYNISAETMLLLANESKIFTSNGQVWSVDYKTNLGSTGLYGRLVEIPTLELVAVLSTSKPGTITFVKSSDYTITTTSAIPSVTSVGPSLASSAGSKLFVNTNNGIKVIDVDTAAPSSISVLNGSLQSVQVSNAFAEPLKIKLRNVLGNPMPGVAVTFTAPSAGATGLFADTNSNTTVAVTDENGIATSSVFTANSVTGSYVVKATISSLLASADFQLTNMAPVTCTDNYGTENGIFLPYRHYDCGMDAYAVGAGDFDHDNRKDVVLSVRSGTGAQSNLLVFAQDSNGNLSQPRVYAGGNRSETLVAGDINNDELDDVITADFADNKISVFLQRSDKTLNNRVTYAADIGPDAMAIGDVNGDDLNDIVVSHSNASTIAVFTQKSDGTLHPMVTYSTTPTGNNDIAIGDLNHDGLNDVAKLNGSGTSGNLLVYLQNNNHTLNSAIPYTLANCTSFCTGNGLDIGDVTGDGRADVVMSYGGNISTSRIAVFQQGVNGSLQPSVSYFSYDIPEPVEIADINSDNLLDVIVLHGGWKQAGVYLQQQMGTLRSEALSYIPFTSSYESQALSIHDINDDNLSDVLIADRDGLVVLYRDPVIPPTPTPYISPTPGPGPTKTPGPTSTAGPSPTSVPPSSTGNRMTYTAGGGSTLPGAFLCDQDQSPCTNGADPDADAAHQYAADTFVFYNLHHGHNSFDNHGGTITSTVNYGLNYGNAFWTGSQMVYGDGMAADDVVGHEITHGVTQYTSNLIYSYQSGAINESFSDIWGEFIDQTNGSADDTPSVKWMLGEGSALGVIRNMSNPPAYGDPDKMSSPYYYQGGADNGGVHFNSGVNNKAAYLMVEGGTFNGRTISGIGLDKTAAVYYEAQAQLLTAGSNYNDLYYALVQACQNLLSGSAGITENDCEQVRTAAEAVEMVSEIIVTPTPDTPTDTPTSTPTLTVTATRTLTPSATVTLTHGTIAKPGVPVLVSPANGGLSNSLQPGLDWRDSNPGAHRYQVQVSTNNTFSGLVVNDSNVMTSTFTPASDLIPGKLYYWRVRAFNGNGVASGWSTAWTFKTPLAQPTLVSPANGEPLLTDRPSFTWDAIPGATSYSLQVSRVENFGTLLINETVTSAEYNMITDLPQNKTLFWRVRAKTSAVNSPWSAKWTFKTGNPPSVPVLVAPTNGVLVKNYMPVFNWNNATVPANTTFKHYELQVDEQRDFSSPVTLTTTPGDSTDSDFTPLAALASNTRFYWRVRAINTIGLDDDVSGWSSVWSFRTVIPAPQALTMTPSDLKPLQPSFNWDEASGSGEITGYSIQISATANFSTLLVNGTTIEPTYVLRKDMPSGRTIYWRVRINGANGPSAWTITQFVTP